MTESINNGAASSGNDANTLNFFIQSLVDRVWTSTLVVVKSVSNNGDLSPSGLVSIQPLVGMIDSDGVIYPHGEIYDAPYFRLQGGSDAIILDPKVGDIGIALFASRDISAAKNAKKPSPPGSARKFHPSDAMYIGGVLNGAPIQYIRYSGGGIELVSPSAVKITAPEIMLNGHVTGQNATFSGDVTAVGKSVSTHKHSGVQSGGSNTGSPV